MNQPETALELVLPEVAALLLCSLGPDGKALTEDLVSLGSQTVGLSLD